MKCAQDVFSVQFLAYSVEAEIIGSFDLPPLKESVEALQQSQESFFGYYDDDQLCGMISINIEGDGVDICRLVVHPAYFKQGIAQSLLNFIEHESECERFKVATGTKNTPAINFYKKNGFQTVKEMIVSENIHLTFLVKCGNDVAK